MNESEIENENEIEIEKGPIFILAQAVQVFLNGSKVSVVSFPLLVDTPPATKTTPFLRSVLV
jgi:hypothetical protein